MILREETLIGMDFLEQVSLLVRERRSALAALARAEGLSPEDAVDCVQEGLCTFLLRRELLPADVADWHASLAVMVRNAARNRRRRRYLAQPHLDVAQPRAELPADAPPADDMIARAESHVRLQKCVAELCEIQKAVV